jgi:hypothetical protein
MYVGELLLVYVLLRWWPVLTFDVCNMHRISFLCVLLIVFIDKPLSVVPSTLQIPM